MELVTSNWWKPVWLWPDVGTLTFHWYNLFACKSSCWIDRSHFGFVPRLELGPFFHSSYFHKICHAASLEAYFSFSLCLNHWTNFLQKLLVWKRSKKLTLTREFIVCGDFVPSKKILQIFLATSKGFIDYLLLHIPRLRTQTHRRFNGQIVITLFKKEPQFEIRRCEIRPWAIATFHWDLHCNRLRRLFIWLWST